MILQFNEQLQLRINQLRLLNNEDYWAQTKLRTAHG